MQMNVLKDGVMSGEKRSRLPVSAIAGYLCFGAVVLCAAASGCAYRPIPMSEVPFKERAQTKTDGNVRVTVAVLCAKESRKVFGVDLGGKGIQSVWVKIENNDNIPYWFPPHTLDPNYYSPAEVAWKNHFILSGAANKEMDVYFERMSVPRFIQPGATISGFAFVSQDLGTKEVSVALFGPRRTQTFMFFVPVPGIKTDYEEVDFDKLYPKDKIVSYDEAGLHAALKSLPPCTTGKNAKEQGDPLNLVVIGNLEDIFSAFTRSGWDETERMHAGSALETGWSFLFGTRYRYAPISSLYVYGRGQDISFQKARETIHERNHLRLWLTPKRFEGKSVWIGQISRDIGVRFTSKTLMTHKIDPDVDEARGYIVYDLISTHGVARLGFVGGVGAADVSKPRGNLTGDPYYTDGLRAVLMLSGKPVPFSDLEFFKWKFPATVEKHRDEWLKRK